MLKRSPLKTKTPLKARKRLARLGRRKKMEIERTGDERKAYLKAHPGCEVGVILAQNAYTNTAVAAGARDCTIVATGVHERKKRSQGGSLTDPANLLGSCGRCNVWVEDHPSLARDLGLTVLSYDNPADVPIGVQ